MKLKLEVCQILSVAAQAVFLSILSCLLILHLILTDFYYAEGSVIFIHGNWSGKIELLAFSIGMCFYFLFACFIFKDMFHDISRRIGENRLTRKAVWGIWTGILGILLCILFFLVAGMRGEAETATALADNAKDISQFIQPLILIGYLGSLLCYFPINRLYHSYCSKIVSLSSEQLQALALHAKMMKWLAYTGIILTGWLVIPLAFYFLFPFPLAIKALKQM